MLIRRVVTGHSDDGRSIVVGDDLVEGIRPALMPRTETHDIWGSDVTPHFPDDGSKPTTDRYFPPLGGFRFGFFAIPPVNPDEAPSPPTDMAAALAEFETLFPGMADHLEPNANGMHTTATIDLEVVVEGEVWLELDDGVSVHLKAGDTVIQNGTRHAWRNHGTQTARVAAILIGAHHDKVSPR